MRYSVISSSVANFVAQAIDCLVAAGLTVRTRLHHMSMRERQLHGHELHRQELHGQEPQGQPRLSKRRSTRSSLMQPSFASNLARLLGNPSGRDATGVSNLWQGLFSKRPTQHAFAYCPAHAAAIATAARRG